MFYQVQTATDRAFAALPDEAPRYRVTAFNVRGGVSRCHGAVEAIQALRLERRFFRDRAVSSVRIDVATPEGGWTPLALNHRAEG